MRSLSNAGVRFKVTADWYRQRIVSGCDKRTSSLAKLAMRKRVSMRIKAGIRVIRDQNFEFARLERIIATLPNAPRPASGRGSRALPAGGAAMSLLRQIASLVTHD